jgi:hypothetical protein
MFTKAKNIRESKPEWLVPLKEENAMEVVWNNIVEVLSLAFNVDRAVILELQNYDHLWAPYEIGEAKGLCLWDAIGQFYYEKHPIEWMFAYLFTGRDPENDERIYSSCTRHITDLYNVILRKDIYKTAADYVDCVLQVFGLQGKDQFTFTNRHGLEQWVENATGKYLDGQGLPNDSESESEDD